MLCICHEGVKGLQLDAVILNILSGCAISMDREWEFQGRRMEALAMLMLHLALSHLG
jgi:hypothetical protein